MQKRSLKTGMDSWNRKTIVELPISHLWVSVRETERLQKLLLKDLPVNGLKNPILVVDATFAELEKQKTRYGVAMHDIPKGFNPNDRIYVIWGGSQRVMAAKKLGYTHIDCVIYDNDFASAFKSQQLHRKDYDHWYNVKG